MRYQETNTQQEKHNAPNPERISKFGKAIVRAVAYTGGVGVVTAAAIFAGAGMHDRLANAENTEPYHYSDKTAEYIVQPGEGVLDAAKRVIGIENVDSRQVVAHIEKMDENKEVLSDGLQAYETLIYSETVKP
jgi:hypothetical protein